jgi:hypothetical protein
MIPFDMVVGFEEQAVGPATRIGRTAPNGEVPATKSTDEEK